MKILFGICVGMALAFGINAWKAWTYHQKSVDPITVRDCSYEDRMRWNTALWHWESYWECVTH